MSDFALTSSNSSLVLSVSSITNQRTAPFAALGILHSTPDLDVVHRYWDIYRAQFRHKTPKVRLVRFDLSVMAAKETIGILDRQLPLIVPLKQLNDCRCVARKQSAESGNGADGLQRYTDRAAGPTLYSVSSDGIFLLPSNSSRAAPESIGFLSSLSAPLSSLPVCPCGLGNCNTRLPCCRLDFDFFGHDVLLLFLLPLLAAHPRVGGACSRRRVLRGNRKKSRWLRLIFSEGPQPGGTAKPEAEAASAGRTGIRPPAVPARRRGVRKGK